MRTKNLSSVSYAPGAVPDAGTAMGRFLYEELQRIAAAISALAAGHLDKSYAAPAKPRDGDVRYADGTTWNPGSGAGIYWYNGTVWTKL